MGLMQRIKRWREPLAKDQIGEQLAMLVLAARDDPAFGRQVKMLLALPSLQRASIIHSAVDEMKLKGEPADLRAAFAVLATDEGAAAARDLL